MHVKTRLIAALSVTLVVGTASWATAGLTSPAGAATGTAGSTWGLSQPVPGLSALTTPTTSGSGGIKAITCAARGDCVAVGFEESGSGSAAIALPVVLTETAGTWGSPQQIAGSAGLGSGKGADLTKVACADATDCTATGVYNGTDGRGHAFYATETAGAWSAATAVSEAGQPAGTYSLISGVSCVSSAPGYCAIVGYYETPTSITVNGTTTTGTTVAAFILDETQGTWETTPQSVPGLASLSSTGNAELTSVSCPAQEECSAGGGIAGQPFVVSESSGTWGNAQPVTGVSAGAITAISCPAASDCTAAGYYDNSSSLPQLFTVDEQQGSWGSATLLVNPAILDAYTNLALGCSSAGNCVITDTAVIGTARSGHQAAVADAETSSGKWGSLAPVAGLPKPTSPSTALLSFSEGLSCVPGGNCTIVGFYDTAKWPDAIQWFTVTTSGGGVGNEQPVMPPMAEDPTSTALSCPQTGFCTLIYSQGGDPELVTEATGAGVTVTASATRVTYGSEPAETLTATVTGADGGTPTGTVTVTRPSGSPLCTITLTGGTGTCRLATPGFTGTSNGAYQLTASYSGDGNYVAASGTTIVTVARAATATSLSLTPVKVAFSGKSPKLTFAGSVTSSAGIPTGTTSVSINGRDLLNCDGTTVSAGKSTCTSLIGQIAPGRYSVVLEYSGSTDFAPSSSMTHYLTISRAKTTTTLSLSKSQVTYGHESQERLTVSVSHVGGVYPTGRVTVKAGGTTLCTISLIKGKGSCTLKATKLKAGTYHLTASFPGNSNYLKSTSSTKTLKVAS